MLSVWQVVDDVVQWRSIVERQNLELANLRREVTRLEAELAQREQDSAAERSWRQAIKGIIGLAWPIKSGKEELSFVNAPGFTTSPREVVVGNLMDGTVGIDEAIELLQAARAHIVTANRIIHGIDGTSYLRRVERRNATA